MNNVGFKKKPSPPIKIGKTKQVKKHFGEHLGGGGELKTNKPNLKKKKKKKIEDTHGYKYFLFQYM